MKVNGHEYKNWIQETSVQKNVQFCPIGVHFWIDRALSSDSLNLSNVHFQPFESFNLNSSDNLKIYWC